MKMLPVALLSLLLAMPLTAKQQALSKQSYQRLQQSQQLIEAGDTAGAIAQLEAMLTDSSDHPYEQAVVLQTLAHAHIARQDHGAAVPLLERSLALSVLPDAAQQRLRYNLAQLYLASERFEAAIEQLQQWLAKARALKQPARAEVHAMLGSARLQLKQYKAAIAPLRQAIALSKTAKESWYQGLLGARHELKQYDQCAKLLREMIALFPQSTRYWRQLAGIELGRERFNDALAVLELAWRRGYLQTERDLLQLAQLYLHRAEPYKAAELLLQEIADGNIAATAKHWQLAADAWYQARETKRSIAALQQALKADPLPDRALRLARLQLEEGDWQAAESSLARIVEGKGLDAETRGRAWLLLGMARYEGKARATARAAFAEAGRIASSRADAQQWLNFLAAQE